MSSRADLRTAWAIGCIEVALIPLLLFVLGPSMRSVLGSGNQAMIYQVICFSVRSLLPLVAWGIAYYLLRCGDDDFAWRRQLFLLAMCTTVMSLVQYPYATAIYFFYIAPLVFLTLHTFVAARRAPRRSVTALALFFLAFAVPFLNRGYNRSHGVQYNPAPRTARLALPKGGLHVYLDDRRVYEELVQEIQSRTAKGEPIFAGPECPLIYFLSGRPNPTRPFFDLFAHPDSQADEIMSFLRENKIRLVVINNRPEFSVPVGDKLKRMLADEYPKQMAIREFLIRWREETTQR